MLKFTIKISLYSPLHISAQRKLPEDGPDGPKHVEANIKIF